MTKQFAPKDNIMWNIVERSFVAPNILLIESVSQVYNNNNHDVNFTYR